LPTDNIKVLKDILYCNTVVGPPKLATSNPYACLDSGATGNIVAKRDAPPLQDREIEIDDGPTILPANGTDMPTKLQGQLSLSDKLSPTAQSAFVLEDLQTGTLISLGQLCDDDCIAIFTKYDEGWRPSSSSA
jgi:hypothetical protein